MPLAELRAAFLASSKSNQRARIARELGAIPGGDAILLELLEKEPEASVRSVIAGSLRDVTQPATAAALHRLIAEDTDDGVAPPNTGPGDFPGGEIRAQIVEE